MTSTNLRKHSHHPHDPPASLHMHSGEETTPLNKIPTPAFCSWKPQSSSPINVFHLVNISVIPLPTPSQLPGWECKPPWCSTKLWTVKNMLKIKYATSPTHLHWIAYMLKIKHMFQCFAGTEPVLSDAWKLIDLSLTVSIGFGSHLVAWYLRCTMWCQQSSFLAYTRKTSVSHMSKTVAVSVLYFQ